MRSKSNTYRYDLLNAIFIFDQKHLLLTAQFPIQFFYVGNKSLK